jgi:hypothetical protein
MGPTPAPARRVLLYVILLCYFCVAARGLCFHVVGICIRLINCSFGQGNEGCTVLLPETLALRCVIFCISFINST